MASTLRTESGAPVADNQNSQTAGAWCTRSDRVMKEEERRRLVANLAASLAQVSRFDIAERSIAQFRAADPEYGARVEAAVKELRE